MNSRRSLDRYRHFSIVLLLSVACGDGALVDTATAKQAPTARAEDLRPPVVTPTTIAGGGGLRVAVYEGGNADGPPIVFIHGFTGNYLSWERQLSGSLRGWPPSV